MFWGNGQECKRFGREAARASPSVGNALDLSGVSALSGSRPVWFGSDEEAIPWGSAQARHVCQRAPPVVGRSHAAKQCACPRAGGFHLAGSETDRRILEALCRDEP